MVQYLNHHASLVPLLTPPPCLVLHQDHVGHAEGSQYLGVLGEDSTLLGMPACQSNLSLFSSEQPLRAWPEVLWADREEILDCVTEDNLGWAPSCVPVRRIAVAKSRRCTTGYPTFISRQYLK